MAGNPLDWILPFSGLPLIECGISKRIRKEVKKGAFITSLQFKYQKYLIEIYYHHLRQLESFYRVLKNLIIPSINNAKTGITVLQNPSSQTIQQLSTE
ncbi:hypothetical protein TI10_22240 [Photorhabdus luminescens subsp. luminescens]|nr:hypothetical protein TI10_22240 [Photorhabdus luminescens subsp. luminescens]